MVEQGRRQNVPLTDRGGVGNLASLAGQTPRRAYSGRGDDVELLATVGNRAADGTAKEKFPTWNGAIKAKDGFAFRPRPVGRVFPSESRSWPLRHAWECLGVVCGLVRSRIITLKSPPAEPTELLAGPRAGCSVAGVGTSTRGSCRSADRLSRGLGFRDCFLGCQRGPRCRKGSTCRSTVSPETPQVPPAPSQTRTRKIPRSPRKTSARKRPAGRTQVT